MQPAALIVAVVAIMVAIASAVYTKHSAVEARKARLDALGPSVTIATPEPARERWQVLAVGDSARWPPGLVTPGTSYDSPGSVAVKLLIGSRLVLTNEGAITAHVTIDAYRADMAEGVDWLEDVLHPSGPPAPDTLIAGGGFDLEPKRSIGVFVRSGPTVGEWIRDGDQPVKVRIEASASPEGARLVWELTMRTQLLTRVPENASRFELRSHQMIKSTLTRRPREYRKARRGD